MSRTIHRILGFALVLTAGLIQTLPAAVSGIFTYQDNGSSVTITQVSNYFRGNLVVPATLGGKPVTAIGPDACLYARAGIETATLPASVTAIGRGAFRSCFRMTSVTMSEGLVRIDESAFQYCRSLTAVAMPSSLVSIGKYAFDTCEKLNDIQIPQSVTEIDDGAFSACKKITRITIPANVTRIGAYAFSGTGLTEIAIPRNVKSLGDGAFSRCVGLKHVEIDANPTEIGAYLFNGCAALNHIDLPDSVVKIGASAFAGTGLRNIRLDGVKQIGREAFRECDLLASAILPRSVGNIGDHAFSDCNVLGSAVFEGNAPEMGRHVFHDGAPGFKIFVSETSKGFTVPRWMGYRLSAPDAEITVQQPNGGHVLSGTLKSKLGIVLVGTTGGSVIYTIRNAGNRRLMDLTTKMKGDASSDYLVIAPPKASLAPGRSTTIELVFKPKKKGKRLADLEIHSSDPDEDPFVIHLSGVGLQPL